MSALFNTHRLSRVAFELVEKAYRGREPVSIRVLDKLEPYSTPTELGRGRNVKHSEHGFTLVEMLVALVIFGLLASAGTALLVSSVDAQGVVAERLDQSAGLRRVQALAQQDLSAALMRPARTASGDAPAFEAQSGTRLFALTRGGVGTGLADDPRATVRRVTWRLDQGRLTRAVAEGSDARAEGQPVLLASEIAAVMLRYRSDGVWQDAWRPSDARQLPQAVEIAITYADGRTALLRLPMGPGR